MPRKSALNLIRQADSNQTDSSGFSLRNLLTLTEAARELRCSKTHIHNIIAGKVNDLPPLPVLRLGRRRLIRQHALTNWMLSLEAR
jgi:excisionase family DNA binding protein